MPRVHKPAVPKDVFVAFDGLGIDSDPFVEGSEYFEVAQQLYNDVCGTIRIPRVRCTKAYDAETQTVLFMFHFDRPKWADKAAQRAALLKGASVTVLESEE